MRDRSPTTPARPVGQPSAPAPQRSAGNGDGGSAPRDGLISLEAGAPAGAPASAPSQPARPKAPAQAPTLPATGATAAPAAPTVDTLEDALGALPEYRSPVRTGSASFEQLVRIHGQFAARVSDASLRRSLDLVYPAVRAAFERSHGRIEDEWWSGNPLAGAVRTSDEFHSFGSWLEFDCPTSLVVVLNACDRLAAAVGELPRGAERRRCLALVYQCATAVLAAMRASRTGPGPGEKQVALIEESLAAAEAQYARSAARQAQLSYVAGTVIGFAALVLLTGLGLAALGGAVAGLPVAALAASAVAGGLGAVLSVMSRIAGGGLTASRDASGRTLRALGALRPFVGATIGAALHVLVLGGLLPIAQPLDVARAPMFFVGLAFIAGFGERWAQDLTAQQPRRSAGP